MIDTAPGFRSQIVVDVGGPLRRLGYLKHAMLIVMLLSPLMLAFPQQIPALVVLQPDLLASNPGLATRRAVLVQERSTLHGKINSLNGRCAAVEAGSAADVACQRQQGELLIALNSHIQESNDFNASVQLSKVYRPSGSALLGGTTWIVGYNVQNADPKLVAKEREMMALQMKLANSPYSDGVDFTRYNFVLGIAASTDVFTDLSTRVIFDELTNGKFSVEEQKAYDSLKNRQFNELACHSNSAMICLAALENKEVIADRVVLYGPQITIESLGMWDELVRSGRVKSVQIYINRSDPVPPVSLLAGGGLVDSAALSTFAMFKLPTITRIINETSPRLTVQTFSCGDGIPALDCHAMKAYEARVNYKAKTSQQTVPGTKLTASESESRHPHDICPSIFASSKLRPGEK